MAKAAKAKQQKFVVEVGLVASVVVSATSADDAGIQGRARVTEVLGNLPELRAFLEAAKAGSERVMLIGDGNLLEAEEPDADGGEDEDEAPKKPAKADKGAGKKAAPAKEEEEDDADSDDEGEGGDDDADDADSDDDTDDDGGEDDDEDEKPKKPAKDGGKKPLKINKINIPAKKGKK